MALHNLVLILHLKKCCFWNIFRRYFDQDIIILLWNQYNLRHPSGTALTILVGRTGIFFVINIFFYVKFIVPLHC